MVTLKRISAEEAQQYISTKDDFLGSEPAFFTLNPGNDGWENVVYYTTRKKTDYSKKEFIENVHYYLENGMIIFTAQYLKEKGKCCGNKCRHCPYGEPIEK